MFGILGRGTPPRDARGVCRRRVRNAVAACGGPHLRRGRDRTCRPPRRAL